MRIVHPLRGVLPLLLGSVLLVGCEAEEPREEFEVRGAPLGTEQNPTALPDTAAVPAETPAARTPGY